MSKLEQEIIIGIDLAAIPKNPTGWVLWKNKEVSTRHLYKDEEILKHSFNPKPAIIAIDAPLTLPKRGATRKADREMHKHGYPVLPPLFPAMKKLTLRAIEIRKQITKQGVKVIEVHPTSTRKALKMPEKDWEKIQNIFIQMGLEGDPKTHGLTPHKIDAVTAALTAHLHLQGKTEQIGNQDGYIVVPIKTHWRKLQL